MSVEKCLETRVRILDVNRRSGVAQNLWIISSLELPATRDKEKIENPWMF